MICLQFSIYKDIKSGNIKGVSGIKGVRAAAFR